MESFEIVNYDKWRNTIEKIGGASQINKDLGISHSVINNSIREGNESKPSSINIKKILDFYAIPPKKAGVKVSVLPKYAQRIIELREEQNLTRTQLNSELAKFYKALNPDEINLEALLSKSTLSKWETGKDEPSDAKYKILAKFFNVSTSYLKGETDIKNADYQIISENTGLNVEAIDSSKAYQNRNIFGEEMHKAIKEELGFDYSDVANFLISDKQLIDTFYDQAVQVISYYTSDNARNDFDNFFNEREFSTDLLGESGGTFSHSMPYRVTSKNLVKKTLYDKISMTFDDFIDNIMKKNKNNEFYQWDLLAKEHELKKELARIEKNKTDEFYQWGLLSEEDELRKRLAIIEELKELKQNKEAARNEEAKKQ